MMTDIYQAISTVRIARARALVDIYMTEVTAFKASVDAEAARVDALVKAFNAEIEGYRADVQAYQALSTVEAEILRTQGNLAVARAELYLKNADIQIREYEVLNGLRIEVIKSMGVIVAQEVAGALSSIHANAGMTRSDGASYSYTESHTVE
jgi:hypothetical protein